MNKQVQLYSKWFNNLKLKVFELFWISVFVFEIFGFNSILINSQARSYRGFIKTINRKFVLPNFTLQMFYFHKRVHYWPKSSGWKFTHVQSTSFDKNSGEVTAVVASTEFFAIPDVIMIMAMRQPFIPHPCIAELQQQ